MNIKLKPLNSNISFFIHAEYEHNDIYGIYLPKTNYKS